MSFFVFLLDINCGVDLYVILSFISLPGLSYLVQASFTEDQFGVVQTMLPTILSSMLVLQEVKYLTI